jgi:short/branched chain acyl-CoA dehydrogenase
MTPCTMLTEEERALQESVRQFSLKHVQPLARQMDEESFTPKELIDECFKAGLMGIETPAEFGGAGMNFFSSILAIEEVSRIDPGFAGMIDIQNTLINNIFFRYATKEQQQKYLPVLATNMVGSFCLTEPGSGSDAFALKTRAEKKGDKWVINGTKIYISNAAHAGVFLVMATVDPSKGYKGITCFIVPRDKVQVGREEKKLGIRGASTCVVNFDNAEVDESDIVLGVGKGYKIAIEMLNEGRIGIGAQQVGLAQGAMDLAMPYLFQRKQFGQFIGDFQGMQFQYAQAAMEIQAARLLVYNAARKKQHGEPFVEDASMCKLFASQVSERVASKAIEWLGGNGFIRDNNNVERFYRDAKAGSIYEGTSNIQLQTIAKFVKERYTS